VISEKTPVTLGVLALILGGVVTTTVFMLTAKQTADHALAKGSEAVELQSVLLDKLYSVEKAQIKIQSDIELIKDRLDSK
jgi:hypothetical protein